MPQKPRRRLTRRTAPPRPTYPGAEATAGATTGTAAVPMRRSHEASRPSDYVARQTPHLRNEMIRVAWVSAVCVGLLAVLAVVDRLQ
jgi:hypothetical protein